MSSQAAQIVGDQSRFEELCRQWRGEGRLAFDTEFIRDDTYDAILCLVQVCDGRQVWLIDPTEGIEFSCFWELVCDPAVVTIVHAGKEDFDLCMRATGKPPRNVFDVQIAAGLTGHGYPLSLSRLVGLVLGRRLIKGQTLTDWLRRPLTREQLRYAVEDVAHLPAAHERLSQQLAELGRTEWAREEFARFEQPELYDRMTTGRVARLKGASKLDGRGLAALERLIAWREQWASEKNRPARALIRDDMLVEIARRRPRKAEDLAVMRGFPQARNPRIQKEILKLLEDTGRLPESELPQAERPREETPMAKVMLDVLSAVARAICHEEGVSYDLVGGTQRARELLDHLSGENGEVPALLRGWRAEFIGRRLVGVLQGRAEVHISGWPENPRLDVVPGAGG